MLTIRIDHDICAGTYQAVVGPRPLTAQVFRDNRKYMTYYL
jgi:hypothetical protein